MRTAVKGVQDGASALSFPQEGHGVVARRARVHVDGEAQFYMCVYVAVVMHGKNAFGSITFGRSV